MAEPRSPAGRVDDRATSPAHLQPDLQPDSQETCPELTSADLEHEDRRVREMQERLARRRADDELVSSLRERGFRGPAYDAFEAELVAYAWAVMDSWLRRGYVFELTKRLKRRVRAGEAILTLLAENSDEREYLATGVVGVTVPSFRQHALVDGGWSVTGGASLPTYFMNAVLRSFPNEYRRWRTEQIKWGRQFAAEDEGQILRPASSR